VGKTGGRESRKERKGESVRFIGEKRNPELYALGEAGEKRNKTTGWG